MVKKALRYVKGTTGLMLTYRKLESLEIEGYSESDFAGDADDRKSTSYLHSCKRERYRGKAPSSQSQHHPRCMLNL